jgi:hypothetical protein
MAHASINRNNILKQLVVSENSIKSNSNNPSPKLVGNGQYLMKQISISKKPFLLKTIST